MLQPKVLPCRRPGQYHLFQHILVGHGCAWQSYDGTLLEIERSLFFESDNELRELAHVVLREVTPLLHAGRRGEIGPTFSASRNWANLRERIAASGRPELQRQFESLRDA